LIRRPFRVTLAWTDAPGSTTGNAFNNNLDLVVTLGTSVYKGNVFSGANSAPNGSADTRNNVESVFISGTSGIFTITVRAVNINSDGVPNNGTPLDQDFALVAYNAVFGNPPEITDFQPSKLIALAGSSVTFRVSATGDEPLQYQWYRDGLAIPRATGAALTIPSVQAGDAGSYSVSINNLIGSVQSDPAPLTVVASVPLPFALNTNYMDCGCLRTVVRTNERVQGRRCFRTELVHLRQSTDIVPVRCGWTRNYLILVESLLGAGGGSADLPEFRPERLHQRSDDLRRGELATAVLLSPSGN
jgi:hypothetical protein